MNKTEKKASNSKLLSPTKLFKRADGKQKGAGLRMGSKLFQVQHYWIRSNCQWLTSRAPGALCECTKKTCLHCVEISLYCYSCACLQWKRSFGLPSAGYSSFCVSFNFHRVSCFEFYALCC
ncbi:uncharacterized protein LOC128340628 isoform X4 [Hemicordylus capensis]|uniref:uncharacterized protein LOC128340628 isoform X4 n=1 Tax=Hemicordylus capensis TaxID=884348 RepID=UPI002303D37D|nr:uncharacterized protein LOC128340628 isoform X4 [Hemicordylus capensis]XP_053141938.1 uncharacterized protein LOC128340628 isoform X4 [Hemicordylus capensis]